MADVHLPCPRSLGQAEAAESWRPASRSPSPTARAVGVPGPGPRPRRQLPHKRRVRAAAIPRGEAASSPTPEVSRSTAHPHVTSPLSLACPGVPSRVEGARRTPDLRPAFEEARTSPRTAGRSAGTWRSLAPRPCLRGASRAASSASRSHSPCSAPARGAAPAGHAETSASSGCLWRSVGRMPPS